MQYGAGLVESSFSAVSRPLANNAQLGALDDFACRQLDRLGAAASGSGGDSRAYDAGEDSRGRSLYDEPERWRGEGNSRGRESAGPSQATHRSQSPGVQAQQAVAAMGSRSRWQTVLVEAGGLGAAVSEESLKSLRYCLQWLLVRPSLRTEGVFTCLFFFSAFVFPLLSLQYATAHLDHQITTLRDFIISLSQHSPNSSNSDALMTASAAHLSRIKHDVVETIRKVVEVVSKYAGAALPEQAKRYVRQSILGLPIKWASAIEEGRGAAGRRADGGTASSASTPTGERMGDAQDGGGYFTSRSAEASKPGPRHPSTEDAAERVLTFAVESLDMLRSVTQIFGESVEKAEAFVLSLLWKRLLSQANATAFLAVGSSG